MSEKRQDINITLTPLGVGVGTFDVKNNLSFQERVAHKYPKGFRKKRQVNK